MTKPPTPFAPTHAWPAEELAHIDVMLVGKAGEVTFRGMPFMSWPEDDPVARDLVVATLLDMGMKGVRIAKLIKMSAAYVSLVRRRVAKGGVTELIRRGKRGPKPLLGSDKERAEIRRLIERGFTLDQVAEKMGVTFKTLARVRREMGLMKPRIEEQLALPGVGESSRPSTQAKPVNPSVVEPAPSARERSSAPREAGAKPTPTAVEDEPEEPEELAAARPLPVSLAEHPTRYAGVMLLMAAMGELGIPAALDAAGVKRRDAALYDAQQVCMALACAWVAGCASVESMHERDARGLGVVLGLERSPSVRTLHRAIAQMVDTYDPIALPRELALSLARTYDKEPLLFGVDGHHKDYFGKAAVDKGWNTKIGEATKGLGDIVVHDMRGTTWATMEVPAGDALSQHLVPVARQLRAVHGAGRPITLAVDRGGFSFDSWNTLAGEGFHYIGWLPATVNTPDLAQIAPSEDGIGEAPWEHPSLTHDARLVVQRDGDRLLPIATNLPGFVDAESVVRLLRKLRGVEENSIKAARKTVHVDSLVDRGISHDAPDDRMVKNPKRKRLKKKLRRLDRTISSFEGLPEGALNPYPEALMLAELRLASAKLELREQPSKLPKLALDPDARRAWLKTRNRGLLQALKYAADNSRRWLLHELGRALAPTDHDYDATTLPRTLDALLKSPGHVRFDSDRLVVTFDIQLPPTAHARLDDALSALSGLRMPFHGDERLLNFRLAPRPTRQTLPHVTQAALATAPAP